MLTLTPLPPPRFRSFHLAFWLLLSFAREALVHLCAIVFPVFGIAPRPAESPLGDWPGLGTARNLSEARLTRESYAPKAACRRRLSAWRLRRESHSRTPYPSAKPTISMIAVSSIESPPIREPEVTIKSHQPYTTLTDAFLKQVRCRSLSSVVNLTHSVPTRETGATRMLARPAQRKKHN
jgi:hypothetical protein